MEKATSYATHRGDLRTQIPTVCGFSCLGREVAGYWHYQCNDFRVSTLGTYELTIHVTDVGPDAEKVVVAPTLEGGGIELP